MLRLFFSGLCLLLLSLGGCALFPDRDPLNINVVGFEPLASQDMEVRFAVKIRVQNPNDTAIVASILSVARHLKLRVVAEGVETRAQADFLIASRCDCLQGYLFGRPEPLEPWVQRRMAGAA